MEHLAEAVPHSAEPWAEVVQVTSDKGNADESQGDRPSHRHQAGGLQSSADTKHCVWLHAHPWGLDTPGLVQPLPSSHLASLGGEDQLLAQQCLS